MKILIVGGAGYVGGAVTDILMAQQAKFRVYDGLFYEEDYRKPVDFVYGDIRDHERLLPHLKWADVVVWLAALVGDGACALHPDVTVDVNKTPIKWLAENFNGRIVFTSTCSVYGAQEGELNEDSGLNPLSVYASTKRDAEQLLETKNAIVFRLGTLFGVSDLFSRLRLDLVVNTLAVRASTQGKITVFGGDQFRPLLHVRDVGHAIVENLASQQRGVYNLHRQNVRIVDLACQIRNHFPNIKIETVGIPFQDSRNYRVSSAKAESELGFKSRYSIDAGIEEIKELIASHRITNVDSPRYTNQKYLSMFNTHLEWNR